MFIEYFSGVKVLLYLQNVHCLFFRFDVHVTPMVFIYSRLFHWILLHFFGICKDQLATVFFFPKLVLQFMCARA